MKNVAIVFLDESSRNLAPFDDDAWEVWAHVALSKFLEGKRVTRWFDPHREEIWQQPKKWNADYQQWLTTIAAPVYMQRHYDTVPTSVPLPFAMLHREFPGAPFAGTFDWMMALAIHEGTRRIGVFGLDRPSLHEAVFQQWGWTYWIGYARGRGIAVDIPETCRVLTNIVPGDYGPDFPPWPMGCHPDDWTKIAAIAAAGMTTIEEEVLA